MEDKVTGEQSSFE